MKILIIDDDRTVCSSLKLLLSRNGFEVNSINGPQVAVETIEEFLPDLILLDMNFTIDTSGKQGIRLLEMIRSQYPSISVILMTGWATVQLAVRGMKLGAKDFIAKPWDNKDLLTSISNIKKLHHSKDIAKPSNVSNPQKNSVIIGESPIMLDILNMVEKVATTEASVLITGESGTGKELIAEAIHENSNRKVENFVKVNLGGIPSNLFESEMFGHIKGAFTGAYTDREGRFSKANNGTIFLDEIGELAVDCQVKLLRVLQEKTYEQLGSNNVKRTNVRVISATNRNLLNDVEMGHFREDLYYRINLINIHLPSLSQRKDDINLLINHFIKNISQLYNADMPYIDSDTFHWLSMQEYKGNIRQLKNIVERTFLLNLRKKDLTRKDFMPAFNITKPISGDTSALNLQKMEIEMIKTALSKYNHSISDSAKALGITRSSLYRRLEKYGIDYEPKV